jgi:predicted RNA-binding Zn-ribbon protein involved in translation (DUF1610 family)
MELIDYIDYDEGRDFPPAMAEELPACESCGKDAASLTYLEGWNFFACPDCVRECDAQELEQEWLKECSCRQTAADEWNNRGCVVHDRRAA